MHVQLLKNIQCERETKKGREDEEKMREGRHLGWDGGGGGRSDVGQRQEGQNGIGALSGLCHTICHHLSQTRDQLARLPGQAGIALHCLNRPHNGKSIHMSHYVF
jgi:hypothetical protein